MISDKTFKFILKPILRGVFKILFFTKYEGKENIPKTDGYIICSNHRSNFDPLTVALGLKNLPHFMAKEELFNVFFLGSLVKWLRAFPVKRGKSDVSAVTTAIDIVQNGKNLLMFPEGTRSKDGELLKPKSGVALIASKAQCLVLPCAIVCKGKIRIFKRIIVRYGKPLTEEQLKMEGQSASEL
ncbi:MAG: lysophospholipid acyltransferase family protein, partial [Clostridia bacterium]